MVLILYTCIPMWDKEPVAYATGFRVYGGRRVMGSWEIRRVPVDWVHPRGTPETSPDPSYIGHPLPMFDQTYREAESAWLVGLMAWLSGSHPDYDSGFSYWEYEPPPDRRYYRPPFKGEPTHYQLYENVSEGTPQTPPMATLEDVAAYLYERGHFAYQQTRGRSARKPASLDEARAFVARVWEHSRANRPNP